MMMEVPDGCWCLGQKWGEDLGELAPGLHMKPSYYKIAYVVTQQACTYDAPVAECPTSDDVRVAIDTMVTFKISNPSKFIYRLGVANFDDFLSGTVDEAIRMLVRREDHMTVFELRGENSSEMLTILNDKFADIDGGVEFTSVKVMDVKLPQQLQHYLEEKTRLDKAKEVREEANKFAMFQIQIDRDMQIEEIKRRSAKVLVAEAGAKKRAELEFEQKSVKAEEDARVAFIEAEAKAKVEEMEAQTQMNRTKMLLETERVRELAKAEANAQEIKIRADLMEESSTIEAQALEKEMLSNAEVIKLEAMAEKEATRNMAAKRKHELDLHEKRILLGLSEKGNFNLVGTSGDRLVNAMMTGSLMKK